MFPPLPPWLPFSLSTITVSTPTTITPIWTTRAIRPVTTASCGNTTRIVTSATAHLAMSRARNVSENEHQKGIEKQAGTLPVDPTTTNTTIITICTQITTT